MSEADIQRAVEAYLKLQPDIWYMRANAGNLSKGGRFVRGAPKGTADIIGCCGGKFFGIEIKGPKGKLSDDQADWILDIRKLGGFATMVQSVDEAHNFIMTMRW